MFGFLCVAGGSVFLDQGRVCRASPEKIGQLRRHPLPYMAQRIVYNPTITAWT